MRGIRAYYLTTSKGKQIMAGEYSNYNDIPTSLLHPNECYFCVNNNPDNYETVEISISSKENFEANGCLDDCLDDESFTKDLPDIMWNLMESTWESDSTKEEIIEQMVALGFEYSTDMEDYIQDCYQ